MPRQRFAARPHLNSYTGNITTESLTIQQVSQAAANIKPHAVRTPTLNFAAIDDLVGAEVFFKAENLQRTGSFKFRGAMNSLASLSPSELAAGVVAFSSGNHAQAVAAAAAIAGSSSVIVMPLDAPESKVRSTSEYGARVMRYDRYSESREEIVAAVASEEGRTIISPFDHLPVIAGQGTVALELFADVADLDALVVCVGGGGLLAGCATAANALSPETLIFGVEPLAGDDHRQSRAAGRRITIEVPRTIADGQQTTAPGELTWPINERLVTEFLTVTDPEIAAAMRVLFEESKLVAEPSGASAFAALLHAHSDSGLGKARRIGVTISGGNIDLDRFVKVSADQTA